MVVFPPNINTIGEGDGSDDNALVRSLRMDFVSQEATCNSFRCDLVYNSTRFWVREKELLDQDGYLDLKGKFQIQQETMPQ